MSERSPLLWGCVYTCVFRWFMTTYFLCNSQVYLCSLIPHSIGFPHPQHEQLLTQLNLLFTKTRKILQTTSDRNVQTEIPLVMIDVCATRDVSNTSYNMGCLGCLLWLRGMVYFKVWSPFSSEWMTWTTTWTSKEIPDKDTHRHGYSVTHMQLQAVKLLTESHSEWAVTHVQALICFCERQDEPYQFTNLQHLLNNPPSIFMSASLPVRLHVYVAVCRSAESVAQFYIKCLQSSPDLLLIQPRYVAVFCPNLEADSSVFLTITQVNLRLSGNIEYI